MKGLASVLVGIALLGMTVSARPLELGLSAGPSFTSLDSLNDSIVVFNTLLDHLNETFDVHPDVSGVVPPMSSMGTGLYLAAVEQYRVTDWLALGARLEYAGASSATAGFYQGSDISQVDLSYRSHILSVIAGGGLTFVDLGLRLTATGGVGYFHTMLDRRVIFQIPVEYPDAIAGVPAEGDDRYTGGALGWEAGLVVSYPATEWLTLGAHVLYRSAEVPRLKTSGDVELDLNGDERPESLNLSGLAVQLTFSINLDLSLDGGKETVQ